MRSLTSRFCAMVLALFTFAAVAQVQADDDPAIVGTWEVITTFNTPPGSPPFVSHEFASFGSGGTYMGNFALDINGANIYAPPPFIVDFSTKYGTWKQKGKNSRQYSLVLKEYMFAGPNTPQEIYPHAYVGQQVGFATVRATPAANPRGDMLSGPFTVEFTNAEGTVVFTGAGSFTAKRLQ